MGRSRKGLSRKWNILEERAEKAEALAVSRLELLMQGKAWIDELMKQLEGVDLPIGLSDFLGELVEELSDG